MNPGVHVQFFKREHQDLKSLPCEVRSWFTLRMQSGGDVKFLESPWIMMGGLAWFLCVCAYNNNNNNNNNFASFLEYYSRISITFSKILNQTPTIINFQRLVVGWLYILIMNNEMKEDGHSVKIDRFILVRIFQHLPT
jgi:hypothetical protein